MELINSDLRISGYASLFGQADISGDIVQRGAFAASLLSLKDRLPMLFGHETDNPIGVWDRIFEDRSGLFVSGRLIGGNVRAERTARLIREGALSGLSIGYRVKRAARNGRGRSLQELDLWEVSVVAFPMLRTARITQINDIPNTYKKKETRMSELNTETKEMKLAQNDFASTFQAFKDANDERLAALEQKQGDGLLTDKVDRINAALDVQSKRIENLAISATRPVMGGELINTEAKSAWSSYIRTGDGSELASLEGKSLSSSVDAEGGYVAPAETESRIDRALIEASPFRRLATMRRVGAGYFKKPVSAGGASSGWAGETEARIETDAPQLELLEFPAGELYAMPAATQTLLDDGVADVDQWLADEVRDVFAAQETAAFAGGDGVNKPRGVLDYTQVAESAQSWGNLGYVATGTAGGFDADAPIDAIMDLIYAPKTRYRAGASFIMNRRTLGEVRKFKDADGNYIWQPAAEAGQPSRLLGYGVTEVEDMPDVASEGAVMAFGDFRRGYLIIDRQGVRVLRDPYSAKPYVLFYTTKRVGGGVQDFNAIKLLKTSVA